MADDVSVRLGLNANEAKNELSNVEKLFHSFGTKIGKALTGLTGTFAGLFALNKVKDAITSTIEYASTIQDLSDKYRVSTDFLQRYGHAAQKAGASQEALAKGLKFLEVNQAKAIKGGEDSAAAKKFTDVGIAFEKVKASKPEELFDLVRKAGGDAAENVALLGKNALELQGLFDGLNSGALQLNDNIISKENVKRLDDLLDLFLDITTAVRALGATALASLIPAFTKYLEIIGRLQDYGAAPFEVVTRLLGGKDTAGIPQGEAAADPNSPGEILKRHREEAGLAAKPDTATGSSLQDKKEEETGPTYTKRDPKTGLFDLTGRQQRALDAENEGALDVGGEDAKAKIGAAQDAAKEKAVTDKTEDKATKDAAKKEAIKAKNEEKFRRKGFKDQQSDAVRNPGALTLEEAATQGSGEVGAKARQAQEEERLAKQLALQGNKGLAQEHRAKADQLKEELGIKEPKDDFKDALDESEILKKIEENTAGGGANI
jgi:hypothetical protein